MTFPSQQDLTLADVARALNEQRTIFSLVAIIAVVLIIGSGIKLVLDGERIAKLEVKSSSCVPESPPARHSRPIRP